MNQYDSIESVVLGPGSKNGDVIAKFTLRRIPSQLLQIRNALMAIQVFQAVLGYNPWESMQKPMIGEPGEHNECYTTLDPGGWTISVRPKYWSPEMIATFKATVWAAAQLHHWAISNTQ